MVLERKMWQCPVCETFYDTRYEAQWCCEEESQEIVGKETAYICERCGEVFDSGWKADLHEKTCYEPGCRTCRHCATDLRRYYPCPRPSFDKNLDACDYYERDRYHAAQSQAWL